MRGSWGTALVLMMTCSVPPFHAVMSGPTLPGVQQSFGLTQASAQQVITAFVLGYAFAQLVFGPVANGLGRVRALVVGLVIGATGCLLSAMSAKLGMFDALLVGRFLGGLGNGVGVVVGYTVVMEVFRGKNRERVLGLCFSANALLPALGSFVSGTLTQQLGWTSAYYALFAHSLLIAVLVMTALPETLQKSQEMPMRLSPVFRGYLKAARQPRVVLPALLYGLGLSILYCCVAILPFIARDTLHMDPAEFGLAFLVGYLGYLAGGIFCIFTAGRFRALTGVLIGLVISLVGGLSMGAIFLTGAETPITLFGSMFVIFVGLPISFMNCTNFAISSHHDRANASAMLSFIYVSLTFVSVLASGYIHDRYGLILSGWAVGAMVLALLIRWRLARGESHDREIPSGVQSVG